MFPLIVVFIFFIGSCDSCTEFIIRGKDDSITLGRSMDFDIAFKSGFYIEPKGKEYQSILNNVPDWCKTKARRWVNHHKIVIIRPVQLEDDFEFQVSFDGVNEHGLTASVLYLRGSIFENVCESTCVDAISQADVVGYILGTYRSVDEVVDAFNTNTFPCVGGNVWLGFVQPVHFAVTDASGGAIVIEYTEGRRKVYNNTIRVMTNSPTYDWHMTNIKTYFHFGSETKRERKYKDGKSFEHVLPDSCASGLLGLPGDYTSPSRFVRAAALVHYSNVPETSDEAVLTSFHILNSVTSTKGVVEGRHFPVFTYWQVVKDLTNRCYYYKTYDYISVRKICLDDVPNEYSFLPLDSMVEEFKSSVQDVSNKVTVIKDEL